MKLTTGLGKAFLFSIFFTTSFAFAQSNDDAAMSCSTFELSDELVPSDISEPIIRSCTGLINSGRLRMKDLSRAYAVRGVGYERGGNAKRAIEDHIIAIRLNPRDAHAYFYRGIAYWRLKQYKRAVADYSQALKLDAKGADIQLANVYLKRGRAFSDSRNYRKAIDDYNQVVRIDPKYVEAYYNRGRAYEALGDKNRAIEDYGKAIRVDPYQIRAYNDRGLLHESLGDRPRAIADFREILNRTNSYEHVEDARANLRRLGVEP